MSKFSNFKTKWPKSVEKLENEDRLGRLRQDLPPKKTVRWIRTWSPASRYPARYTRHIRVCRGRPQLCWRPPVPGDGSMAATCPVTDSHQVRVNDSRTGEQGPVVERITKI